MAHKDNRVINSYENMIDDDDESILVRSTPKPIKIIPKKF